MAGRGQAAADADYAALLKDDLFWKSLSNTLYIVGIGVPLTLLASFLCAVLLNLKVAGQSIYRVIYFLPSIVPTVASTILWLWILNPQVGILNSILGAIGIEGPNWMSNPAWSKPGLILLGMWGMGGTIVIYLSGLQDVPVNLLEAAEIDGANAVQRFRYVTVPMLSPTTFFVFVVYFIGALQMFVQSWILTQGGPLDSTLTVVYLIYQNGFENLKMGYASAMSVVLFAFIAVVTWLNTRVLKYETHF